MTSDVASNHELPTGIARRRRWRRPLIGLVAAVLAVTGAGAALLYTGAYSVAATDGHAKPVEWVLRQTMERSVRAHARDVAVPAGVNLNDKELARKAFGHYSAACVTCHAAPGRGPDPWVVLYPPAPNLTKPEVVSRWSDPELFWIIKHGIKDTGMIALGPTHKDEDLWAVSAFVRQLPEMTPEQYQQMAREYESRKPPGGEHAHH